MVFWKKKADKELRFWSPDWVDGEDPGYVVDFEEMIAIQQDTDKRTGAPRKLIYDIKRENGDWRMRHTAETYRSHMADYEVAKAKFDAGDTPIDPKYELEHLKKYGLDWMPPHQHSNKIEGQYQRYLASLR